MELDVITVRCGACEMWCARCGGAINVANIWCDLKLMWRGVHGMWRYVVHQ